MRHLCFYNKLKLSLRKKTSIFHRTYFFNSCKRSTLTEAIVAIFLLASLELAVMHFIQTYAHIPIYSVFLSHFCFKCHFSPPLTIRLHTTKLRNSLNQDISQGMELNLMILISKNCSLIGMVICLTGMPVGYLL